MDFIGCDLNFWGKDTAVFSRGLFLYCFIVCCYNTSWGKADKIEQGRTSQTTRTSQMGGQTRLSKESNKNIARRWDEELAKMEEKQAI